jgi:hypothetical protein
MQFVRSSPISKDPLLSRVDDAIQVRVEHAAAKAVRTRHLVVGAHRGADPVDVS